MISRYKASKIYDELYADYSALIKKYNPCKIENSKCLRGTTCCVWCKHLGNNGCKVKALTCKGWFCGKALENKEFEKELEKLHTKKIKMFGSINNIWVYRDTKKSHINHFMIKQNLKLEDIHYDNFHQHS